MRKARIYYKNEEAGLLTQHDDGSFTFRYGDAYYVNPSKPSISLTIPKNIQKHHSKFLFPFFYNLLPEGVNREVLCRELRIDENDDFSLLISIGHTDVIGAITVSLMDDSV